MTPCVDLSASVPASFKVDSDVSAADIMKAHPPTSADAQVLVGPSMQPGPDADPARPTWTMAQILARFDAIDAALKPLARMSFDTEGRVVMTPDGIQIEGVVHEERAVYARAHGLTQALDACCDVCKSPERQKCWLTFQVTLERERLVKEASKPADRVVDMSRVVTPHIARTRAAMNAGLADPNEIPCPTCGIIRWGCCRAVEGLDPMPAKEAPTAGPVNTDHTHAYPPTAKRHVQAHLARDEAAAASGWSDSYMAACSWCGAARWEGCTAVGDEPDFGEPVPRLKIRLDDIGGKPVFMSIPWPNRGEAVARGLFEVCTALVPPMPGMIRPGLRPVARTWESLDNEERDYWHGLVKGYLDGTRDERTVGAVEWAVLGAMVRVFGIGRVR